jgi:hypothetical protein
MMKINGAPIVAWIGVTGNSSFGTGGLKGRVKIMLSFVSNNTLLNFEVDLTDMW